MKRRETAVLITVVIGVVILAVVMYKMSAAGDSRPGFKLALPAGAEAVFEGPTRISSSRSGLFEWTLTCQGLTFYKDRGLVEVSSPFASIPVQDGGTALVEAVRGSFYQESEDIVLSDGVRITLNRDGRLEWVIDGDTASHRKDQDTFYISGVEGLLYPPPGGGDTLSGGDTFGDALVSGGEQMVELSGKRGRYHGPSRIMQIDDEVKIVIHREGEKQWTLFGSNAAYHEEPEIYYISGLDGWMHQPEGEGTRVQAEMAWFENRTRIMRLEREVRIQFKQEGEKEWVLNGDTASFHQDREEFFISRLIGVEKGPEPVEVRAERANYRSREKIMRLYRNVVCRFGDGIRLMSEWLDYDENTGKARTEERVTVEGKGWRLEGIGLEADTNTRKVTVKKSVKVRLEEGFSAN